MWRMYLIEMDDTSMKDYNRSNSKWDIIRKLTTQVFPRVLLNLSLAIIQDTVQRKKSQKKRGPKPLPSELKKDTFFTSLPLQIQLVKFSSL